jgi:flagellar basal-body rod protein FlgF/flagellar basal-body rod protein FlgG
MNSGYYAAATAMVARTQALDLIANNMANSSTAGFRAEHALFSSVLADSGRGSGTELNQAINDYGVLGGSGLNLDQGSLQKTGNNLDLAIEGSGFFVVQTKSGPMYTRNGSFQVSTTGQLLTAAGDPVMGDTGIITMVPGPASISADGTISSNGAVEGKIRLVDFPAGTSLKSEGGTYYSAPAGSATAATNVSVQQGALESSNVNPVTSMVELISAQRSAEMMQKEFSMFSNEMDKTAAQDLPKVG